MKDLVFEDVTADYKDQDGDEHQHTVRACTITDELAEIPVTVQTDNGPIRVKVGRQVNTRTGPVVVHAGDVVVETDRPGIYDVHSEESWASTGYGAKTADPVEE
ncbi:MAG TPA: hypothetical protein VFI97_03590 [Arthrobacter sp.]|nr:hypothetical protein [Arthrobacter sp.]